MLVICTVLVAIGSVFAYAAVQYSKESFVIVAILWALAAFIMTRGQKNPESVKEQVKDAIDEYNHPFLTSFVKIIVYAVFAPILLIASFISYARTRFSYKKESANLKEIEAVLNN